MAEDGDPKRYPRYFETPRAGALAPHSRVSGSRAKLEVYLSLLWYDGGAQRATGARKPIPLIGTE